MQKQHASSGKFVAVISYAQASELEAIEFLKTNAPELPVYDQLNPANAPCGNGIPDAYLFDHTGKLVRHGHPQELLPLVGALVEAVPDPIPPDILGEFTPKHCLDEARSLQDATKPAQAVLAKLDVLAASSGEAADEARELLAQVHGWLPREAERMEQLAPRLPGRTAFQADQFLTRFKGVRPELDSRIKVVHVALLEQPGVKDFVAAAKDFERATTARNATDAALFRRRAETTLTRIATNPKASAALKKEAAARLQE